MTITVQGIITAAAFLGAIGAIIASYNKAFTWFKNQSTHDKEQDEKIEKLSAHHEEDMHESREERQLLVYGLLACLKGLKEQGCNGPVTEAIGKLEKYLNTQAHK